MLPGKFIIIMYVTSSSKRVLGNGRRRSALWSTRPGNAAWKLSGPSRAGDCPHDRLITKPGTERYATVRMKECPANTGNVVLFDGKYPACHGVRDEIHYNNKKKTGWTL